MRKITQDTFRIFWRHARRYRGALTIMLVSLAAVTVVEAIIPFFYKRFFDVQAPSTCQFDHLRMVKAPFAARYGGRMHVRKDGKVQAIRGGVLLDRKSALTESPASRSYRCRSQHG